MGYTKSSKSNEYVKAALSFSFQPLLNDEFGHETQLVGQMGPGVHDAAGNQMSSYNLGYDGDNLMLCEDQYGSRSPLHVTAPVPFYRLLGLSGSYNDAGSVTMDFGDQLAPTNFPHSFVLDQAHYGSGLSHVFNSTRKSVSPGREHNVMHPRLQGNVFEGGTVTSNFGIDSHHWESHADVVTYHPYYAPDFGTFYTSGARYVDGGKHRYATNWINQLSGKPTGFGIPLPHFAQRVSDLIKSGTVSVPIDLTEGIHGFKRWSAFENNSHPLDNGYQYDYRYLFEIDVPDGQFGHYRVRFQVRRGVRIVLNTLSGVWRYSLPEWTWVPFESRAFIVSSFNDVTLVDWIHPDKDDHGQPLPIVHPWIRRYTCVVKPQAYVVCEPIGDGNQLSTNFQSLLQSLLGGPLPGKADNFVGGKSIMAAMSLASFSSAVNNNMDCIRPTGYLAVADAMEKDRIVLKTNLIQILQHLPELKELLPNLKDLPQTFKSMCSGNWEDRIAAIDYLTSEILRYRFGTAPTERYAESLFKLKVKHTLDTLASFFRPRPRTVYGVFRYTFKPDEVARLFPNWEGVGDVTLVSQAKVRYFMDLSAVMASLMLGDSIGVLPTFSRIWEILPFSFVADWLTNAKKRIHLMDEELLEAVCCQYLDAVYSYKLEFVPSQELLDTFGLTSDDFSVTHYLREWSCLPPMLRDAKCAPDYLGPTNPPDLVTVGSLLFQVLK